MRKALSLLVVLFSMSVIRAQGPESLPEKEPLIDPLRLAGLMMGISMDFPPQGDTSVIDVLVVYSNSVWTSVGGTEAAALTFARQGSTQWTTAKTNEAAGGNIVPLNILGVYHSTFVEGQANHGDSCLYWMGDTSAAGGRAAVWAERNRIGADLVACISNSSNDNCGLGWLYVTAEGTPYSSSHYTSCTIQNLSMIHEIGHNHGLNHEPQSACGAPTCSGSNYGFGWGGPASGSSVERDPMTYPREGGSRVLWWSSPLFHRLINGVSYVIGTAASNDNLKQLIAYGPTIAGFRARVVNPSPAPAAPGKAHVTED